MSIRKGESHDIPRIADQSVVVCGHLDQPKRTMLDQMGYSIASEWYVHNL